MASNNQTHLFLATLALLYISILSVATDSAPPPEVSCSDQVVAFSPCLPYISSPPNNVTFLPSSQCCELFFAAFDYGKAACLCYLVRRPLLIGFPLNTTRLISLSSLCPLRNGGSNENRSLESFCSGSSALPPLHGIIGPVIPRWHHFGDQNMSHESPPGSSPDVADTVPPELNLSIITPSASLQPDLILSAAKHISSSCWLSLEMMIFLVTVFTDHYFAYQ